MPKQVKPLMTAVQLAEAHVVLADLLALRARIARCQQFVGAAEVITVSLDHPAAETPLVFSLDPDVILNDLAATEHKLESALLRLGVEVPEPPEPAQPALPLPVAREAA